MKQNMEFINAVLVAADAWASAVLSGEEAFNIAGQVLLDAINRRRLAVAAQLAKEGK